jgi:dTDP-L-rhamnose 4-epimerase
VKILITGGAGFIGTHLSRKLLAAAHELTFLDNFSPQIHGENAELPADLKNSIRLIRGDVRDPDIWERVLRGQEAVVHLAAETGTGQSMYEVSRYEQVNVAGTALLYEHLIKGKHNVERVLVASSRAIYGEGAYRCANHGVVYPTSRSTTDKKNSLFDPGCPQCGCMCEVIPTPETAPLQPSSFYGLTKQIQEQMTLLFGGVLGITAFALRYQNVFGSGQSLDNPYTGVLAIFSKLACAGHTLQVFEDGLESRDFVHIGDVVRATCAALQADAKGCHSVNVGSGVRTTLLEVAQAVNKFYGGKSDIKVTGAFRDGDIRHGLADVTRAKQLLNYEPRTGFHDGLYEFLEWAQEETGSLEKYERSLTEMRDQGLLHGS